MIVQLFNGVTAANNPPVATKATASITTVAAASIIDGETFALVDASGSTCVFVFQKTATFTDPGRGSPRMPVNIIAAVTADDVRDAIITAVNNCPAVQITAASGGAATVALTQDRFGPDGNTVTVESVVNAGFVITSFSGGTLSGADITTLRRDRATAMPSDKMAVIARSTAGSGVMTMTLKMWGFRADVGAWVPFGSSTTDANRGLLNAATAIGELAAPADQLLYSDVIDGMWSFERAYLEVVAIGGVATAISAWLVRP